MVTASRNISALFHAENESLDLRLEEVRTKYGWANGLDLRRAEAGR